jgi:mono/diheme cytochrome c family protein
MVRYPYRFAALICALAVARHCALAQEKVDFSKTIQPIFASTCYECHSDKKPKGKLRLDSKDLAFKGGTTGKAITPGNSKQSYLIKRLKGEGGEDRMPLDHDPLPPAQIALVEQWIDQGAIWPDSATVSTAKIETHWAYVKPIRPTPPAVKNAAWVRNRIDAFVLAKLEKEGLAPSPEADRTTLIRRVYLDLIGLPPSPAEVDAFVHDPSPNAYEGVVDRLLANPHYGERWARHWLDIARYADTNGYEKDRPRTIWPWRDWVINALNKDMPFNQFTIEQIAGDMLPNATPAQRIATGFHRNTMQNEEGGIDIEEYRFRSIVDRVQTTATTWLGQTLQCAQCHNHKYDPFSQKEYYSFFALLNNADEVDYDIPDQAIAHRRAEIERQMAALQASREEKLPNAAAKLAAWEKQISPRAKRWTMVRPAKMVSKKHATMEVLADSSVLVSGDKPNNDCYDLDLAGDFGGVTALRLEVLPDHSCPEDGPGRAPLFSPGDFLLSEVTLSRSDGATKESGSSPRAPNPAWSALKFTSASHSYADKGRSAAACIDGKLDTGWSIKGRTGEPSWAVFNLDQPIAPGTSHLHLKLEQQYIHQMTIGRFRLAVTRDSDAKASADLPPQVETALVVRPAQRSDEQKAVIADQFLDTAPELAGINKKIADLHHSMPKFTQTMVFQERRPQFARVTHLHHRGEFLDEREAVTPGVPAVLPPLPPGEKPNRLALARWLVDESNPLVGRVLMNRHWATLFGRGIVATVGDFGVQGEKPSHPQLLDWLATEFIRQNWSMKAMHRLMVTSATYRQSSRVPPELLARDPQNILLARGPRFRVDAETVRDIALSAAGLLTDKIGGPSVFPPQPAGVSELSYGAMSWPTSKGPDRFRRGLYTYLKRTSLYPGLTTFDAPTTEVTCPLRPRSDTPLQALQVLNDKVFVEAAQGLARRIINDKSATSTGDRATLAFRLAISRTPTADEVSSITNFYNHQLDRFKDGSLKSEQVAVSEALPKPGHVDLNELAAWTTVSRALLNLDEAITKE